MKKNIGILSNYLNYKELFQQENSDYHAINLKSKDSVVELHAFVVDGGKVNVDEISSIREQHPQIPIFYKISDVKSDLITRNITRICAAHKVTTLGEYLTHEQVTKEVLCHLEKDAGNENKKIISFFGTHSGAGVSTTVFNVAYALGKKVKNKVLVLSLNAWDPADYFYTYKGKYLNDLKTDLRMKKLTPTNLMDAVTEYEGFYHLAGNRDIKMQRYYQNDEIEHLINVAKETFDVILIDGGTHFDTANATQSYVSSHLRLLVTSQDDKGYRGYFPHIYQQLIEPAGGNRSDFMLILNKYQPDMSLINEKDLEEELEISLLTHLPDLDVLGPVSIRQKKLLYESADSNYKKNIQMITNLIISEAQLVEINIDFDNERKKGFLNFFRKKEKEEVNMW